MKIKEGVYRFVYEPKTKPAGQVKTVELKVGYNRGTGYSKVEVKSWL